MNKFKKGHVPFNKGMPQAEWLSLEAIKTSSSTRFNGSNYGENNHSWKGGMQTPTTDVAYVYIGVNKRVRRPKHIYEETYGTISYNWVIYHLDGNMKNDLIENLIAIPRAILIKLCSGRLENTKEQIELEIKNFLK